MTHHQRLQQQLVEAGRIQATAKLAGGVAHEINNQMTAVLGFANFLAQSKQLSESDRSDVTQIISAAERSAVITRQLLAFSRRAPATFSVIELNALVGSRERTLRRLLPADISLDIHLGQDVGAVRVDEAQFEQVLINLVLNARDAMTVGDHLEIETARVHVTDPMAPPAPAVHVPAGTYSRLIVRDTGSGMDSPTLERIFEPFFTTKASGQGTGLGLASVYGTVKQGGGFIWVDSEPGKGTTFRIDLPQVAERAAIQHPAPALEPPHGSETILVAEDEEPVRRWMARSLRGLGYTVLEAEDGAHALELARDRGTGIGLLLSDITMPRLDGVSLRARLRGDRPSLPVVLVSGYAFDDLVARGIVDPDTDVLAKPFELGTLAVKIREALDAKPAAKQHS